MEDDRGCGKQKKEKLIRCFTRKRSSVGVGGGGGGGTPLKDYVGVP